MISDSDNSLWERQSHMRVIPVATQSMMNAIAKDWNTTLPTGHAKYALGLDAPNQLYCLFNNMTLLAENCCMSLNITACIYEQHIT